MSYEDYGSGDGGSSGSQGVSGPPQVILGATKPRKPMSAGKASNATQSPSSKGTPADAGVAPSAQDTSSAGVGNPTVQPELAGTALDPNALKAGSPTLPTLAPQGSQNPLVRAIQRVTGIVAPQPKAG
jgi:hypothetical protein